MEPEQFVYWLQGFCEISKPGKPPTDLEWKVITEHLNTVFTKITSTDGYDLSKIEVGGDPPESLFNNDVFAERFKKDIEEAKSKQPCPISYC